MVAQIVDFALETVKIRDETLDEKAENAVGNDADIIDDFVFRYKTTPFPVI